MHNYYQVCTVYAMVVCDDWTTAIDEMWCSYVVYPVGTKMEDNDDQT